MKNKTNILIMALLISVILSSIMVIKVVRESMSMHISRPDTPDSFLIAATYSKMDDKGSVQQVIYTPSLIHYQNQDSTVFQKPKATFNLNPKEMPWRISADSGDSKDGLETIHLVGNVVIHQPSGKNNKETTITTDEIMIYFNKKYAETNKIITIKQPGVTAQALGANADFNINVVSLLSNVKEMYEPSKAGNNNGQPTAYLDADKAIYDRKNHVSSYFGKIKYLQGKSFLNADKLLIYDNETDNKIEKVIAFGKPAQYSTIPDGKEDRINATADEIEYYPKKEIAILIGNAELKQKQNRFSAPYITYDIAKKTILSTMEKCDKNCQQKGATIIIQPYE